MTPVPIHTVAPAATPSAPPHAGHAAPQPPGAPHAEPGTSPQQHPHQESLDTIRNGLDHYPGGLTEPHPHDQQALVNAVPHEPDGTPQRFPDPFGHWSQLQNDGGNQVPGRSNNCADCSRSFLETWYGNPQVSAPRTLDVDQHGNLDPWSPEHDANTNQIKWSGAAHTYAGTGSDPETPNRIASDLQQAGHGAAAIVQVDWPGGGGHAFNAVNHHGNIIWIDTQSGEVSHQPLHIPSAEHVWHIPLDANRNPLHPTPPPETGTSHHDSNNPQEGTGTPHPESDNSPHENDKASEPENSSDEPSKKTPDENTPHSDAETTPHNPPRTDSDNHNGESPSHAEPGPTHADTPKTDGPSTHHPPAATHEPDSGPPHTTDESKNRTESDSVTPPAHDAVQPPHAGTRTDETHTPAPDTGDPTAEHQPPSATNHSGNTDAHPVTNDATHPTSHVARSDLTTDGNHPRHSPVPAPRSGGTSTEPPSSGNADRPNPNSAQPTDRHTTTNQPPPTPRSPERPTPHEPAGSDQDASRPHPEREDPDLRRSRQLPDDAQAQLRRDSPVYRIEHDVVDARMHEWAKNGSLANVLRIAAGDDDHPDGQNAHNARVLTARQLEDQLDGFHQLNRGERMAVVAALARMSHTFHQQYGVTSNPVQTDGTSRGGELHENAGTQSAKILLTNVKNPSENALKHTPDLTGRNYAVIETMDSKGNIRYVVDSSEGQGGFHSEKNLLQWMKEANKGGNEHKITSLYTEREPCGNKKGGLGKGNCAALLSKELKGASVYYSTTYRSHEDAVEERRRTRIPLQREARTQLGVKSLDRKTRTEIAEEVNRRVQSRPEQEMEDEFNARINVVKSLWLSIAEQV
ncbi:toxin glutamine deamidase domain-containing protein [Streptomyces sp. NPDC004129]